MTPIQQLFLGVGASKKTYIEDLFSTYAYTGNDTARSIVTGIDMTKGGLVWNKGRQGTYNHFLTDSVRGANKTFKINSSDAESPNNFVTAFNNNGFSLGTDSNVNGDTDPHVAWSFREQEGFFDIVTYTGTGSTQAIAHSLGAVPGFIIVKNRTSGEHPTAQHRSFGATHYAALSTTGRFWDSDARWSDTAPTATHFTVGPDDSTNKSGDNFVAYIFAGGESPANAAVSSDMDGSDYLKVANHADFNFNGDFTVEGWFKINNWTGLSGIVGLWQYSNNRKSWGIQTDSSEGNALKFYISDNGSTSTLVASGGKIYKKRWYHFAATRSHHTFRLFVNGELVGSGTNSNACYSNTQDAVNIGAISNTTDYIAEGQFSNIRITKGQALYTTSFIPSTTPLTTTSQGATASNVKLLCCNDHSSVTGSTVTSGTITTENDPTVSTDSPFDDPAGLIFGENEDQGLVKCGSYIGTGSSGLEINLGWEPQWLIWKDASGDGEHWLLQDSIRGFDNKHLRINTNNAESDTTCLQVTGRGFEITGTDGARNQSGETYVYVAIRRPDGYVGKPAEVGTDVFDIDGSGNQATPGFTCGFPVDMRIAKAFNANESWYLSTRIRGKRYLRPDSSNEEYTSGTITNWTQWDLMEGEGNSWGSNYVGYLWKRHTGFDVCRFEGTELDGRQIPHNLGRTPEMIWLKNLTSGYTWNVYHKDLNGGSSPEDYYLRLQDNDSEATTDAWNDTAPTATSFTISDHAAVNQDDSQFVAMLFASVDGISKVGYFDGSSSSQTITTGFQPRFLIVKKISEGGDWYIVDTARGWGSGNDKQIKLNVNHSQYDGDMGAPTSTGFTMTSNSNWNGSGQKYIYYAHA